MRLAKYLKKCDGIYHVTLDPKTTGVVRVHLVPPKKLKPGVPWVAVINGYSILPLQSSWAVLLKEFIEVVNEYDGRVLTSEEIDQLVNKTAAKVKLVFKNTEEKYIKQDLKDIVGTLRKICWGEEPDSKIGYMTLAKYSKYMKAPHRMDLMISSMEKDGCWNCNQKCLHCYAANEVKSNTKELSTTEWKQVIDNCKKAGIPSLTFTGGEPTMREDLVELIDYSKWFVTRLNTNGIRLSSELCDQLYSASLDSVQVTLYSCDAEIHNELVGGRHFEQTIQGIKNAISAKLDVSVNTPLCSLNKDFLKTIKYLEGLGVRYFSCSGLIPTGNAKTSESKITALSKGEILDVVREASSYARAHNLELAFTSPGWIDGEHLKKMKMVVPSCGACLSNMAIAPDGDIIPCQSWLNGTSLGNILKHNFKDVWNSEMCKRIRKKASLEEEICLLKEGMFNGN